MRRKHWLLAAGVAAVAGLGSISVAGAVPPAKPKTVHKVTLAGTWSGQYSGAYSGTFTLHWAQRGSKLIGTITLSSPQGKYGVNGTVSGKTINFGTVGAGASYTGSVSGNTMSGTYKSVPAGGTWSAHKTS
jgi:hypothetical protein